MVANSSGALASAKGQGGGKGKGKSGKGAPKTCYECGVEGTSQRNAACARKEWLQEVQNACHLRTCKWAVAKAERRSAKVEKEEKGASKVEMERDLLEKDAKVESKADSPQKQSGGR